MCICMYVCMYVSVCVCVYIYTHTFIHTYVHTYVRTYVHTYIHTHTHTHLHILVHIHIHIHMHTYTRTHTKRMHAGSSPRDRPWPCTEKQGRTRRRGRRRPRRGPRRRELRLVEGRTVESSAAEPRKLLEVLSRRHPKSQSPTLRCTVCRGTSSPTITYLVKNACVAHGGSVRLQKGLLHAGFRVQFNCRQPGLICISASCFAPIAVVSVITQSS